MNSDRSQHLVNRCGCGQTFDGFEDLMEHKEQCNDQQDTGEAWNVPASPNRPLEAP